MPENRSKLSQFWQELKRRRVVHVITVYASAALVIIELVNNLSEPLNLPPNLATIVIIVMAVGFPLAIILSWFYDLTSEGVEKTKPLKEIREREKTVVPNAWKIATYMSLVVIIGLVMLNVIGGGKRLHARDIQKLVILPFENFTGDDQYEWFVSGIHAMLINDVQRVSGFDVLNRTSSIWYKNEDMTLQEIASESGRDAVTRTNVTCVGDSICFHMEVIQVFPKEKILWTAEYKEAKSQIPNIYNRITKQIADEFKIELTTDENMALAKTQTVDTAAFDAYLKGLLDLDKIDRESLQKASEYFNIAIEIEPDWAPPYVGLARVEASRNQMSFISPSIAIPKIYENLNKALELDPNSANAHYSKAVIAVWTEWDWEKGEEEFLKSIELNPSDALCRVMYALLLSYLHRTDEALYQANQALKLDPKRPFVLGLVANVFRGTGDVQSAIALFEKALSIDSTHRFVIYHLSGAYRQNEEYEKWFELFKKIAGYDDKVVASLDSVFQEQGYLAATEMTMKIDEEAAKERYINIPILGFRNLELHNYDKAMDYYEKAYEIHHPNMPSISGLASRYEQLKDNPRYLELLKKMNLPLPED